MRISVTDTRTPDAVNDWSGRIRRAAWHVRNNRHARRDQALVKFSATVRAALDQPHDAAELAELWRVILDCGPLD